MIYHLTTRSAWSAALATGTYAPASLAAEGFIHCSTAAQYLATANLYFRGAPDLLVLAIDESSLPIRFEPPAGSSRPDLFPHLYAPLPLTSVVRAIPLPALADGSFAPIDLA